MTTVTENTNALLKIDKLPAELNAGPAWLTSLRRESQAQYNDSAMPVRTAHLWRYTDPELFLFDRGSYSETNGWPSPPSPDITAPAFLEGQARLGDDSIAALAYQDGSNAFDISINEAISQGKLVVKPLRQAALEHADLVQRYLGSIVGREFGKFEALNGALWPDGLFIFVARGAHIAEPIQLLRRGANSESWTYGRTLIIAGEDSDVTITDECFSVTDEIAGKSNHVVELIGLSGSNTHYFSLQRNNLNSTSYYTQRAALEDRAKTTVVFATLGGKRHKADLGTILRGRGAESLQYGLVFGSGKQQFDHHTAHINRGAHGYSNLDFKVVLKDRAHSAYTGLIRVDENVPNCEAYQTNRNLLLNRGAKAESIPELEILCDEVICTHGATVGPIDEMQVFYLMNRGIPRNEAVKMVVRGFVEPTLKLLPDSLRERIRGHVDERLETL